MKAKEIIEYLQEFSPDAEMRIMAIREADCTRHNIDNAFFITGEDYPAIFVELGTFEDISKEIAAFEEDYHE